MPKGGDQNQDPGGVEVLHSGRLGSDLSEEEADNSPSKVGYVHIDDDMFGIVGLGSGLGLGQLFHKGVLSLHRHVWGSGIGIGIRTILPARWIKFT